MRKVLNKIICLVVAVVLTMGIGLISACSDYFDTTALPGNYSGNVSSQGGFAVQGGDYVYFINGIEGNTADNTFGTPVKGSIMRISTSNLSSHKYSSVETVVPQVAYAGSNNAGLYIYGDYIYFTTPSTARNSSGEVLNGELDFKRAKLDGTEVMANYFLRLSDNTTDYRYVEVDGVVYILYVASESLYNESSAVTNIHSLNTSNGVNTILAYNVASVLFDSEDVTNPQIYYTMNVYNYATSANYGYNQVYTVRADDTTRNSYDFSEIVGWEGEDDVDEGDPYDLYINCGDLVYDGIGMLSTATPFNYSDTDKNATNYTYSLSKYVGGTLFYTRTSTSNSQPYLFSIKDSDITSTHNPVTANYLGEQRMLTDGSGAASFNYVFDDNGDLEYVISTAGTGISINKPDASGKLSTLIKDESNSSYYHIVNDGTATVLFIDGDYLYYSIAGGNGYTFYRLNYTGDYSEYHGMPEPDADGNITTTEYTQVQILDLDSSSDWYMPELIVGQLLFASETDSMSSYNYIMACDISGLNNAALKELSDKYAGIEETITDICEDLDTTLYANLENSLRWAKYTGDTDYINDLAVACNADAADNDLDDIYPEGTLTRYNNFITPTATNEWSEYIETKEVNGKAVYSNRREYYYSVLGKMTDDDLEGYTDLLKSQYLQAYPEDEEVTWWEGLNTAAKVWFVIGMCVIGLLVIGAGVFVTIKLVRKKKSTGGVQQKRRIVDTTDDKSVDVYSDGESEKTEEADGDKE